jgi:hypothetical protein
LGNAPRWLVAFDDASEDDEEIGEKSLGRLVSEIPAGRNSNGSAASSANHNKGDNSDSGTASEIGHESSTSKKSAKASATDTAEATERGASPMLGSTTTTIGEVEDVAGISTRSSAKRKGSDGEPVLYSGVQTTGKRRGGNRGGGKKPKKNEDVVKVKMLTGTLYLYRGDHPRAEFVRFF